MSEETMTLGELIDMSLEDYKKHLIVKKYNLGFINTLSLYLEGVYHDLNSRKNGIITLLNKNDSCNKEELKTVLKGLYAEMIKCEGKITATKERAKELISTPLKGAESIV